MEIEMFLYEITFLNKKASSNNATYLYLYLKLFSFFVVISAVFSLVTFLLWPTLLGTHRDILLCDELFIFRAE